MANIHEKRTTENTEDTEIFKTKGLRVLDLHSRLDSTACVHATFVILLSSAVFNMEFVAWMKRSEIQEYRPRITLRFIGLQPDHTLLLPG